MPAPPLSDELAQEAADAYRAADCVIAHAARNMGLPTQTFQNRLKRAAERGMLGTRPVLPGFRVAKSTAVLDSAGELQRQFVQQKPERGGEFQPPPGHSIKGVSALVDEDGRIINQWIKTREGVFDPTQLAEWLKDTFKDVEPAKPVSPPDTVSNDLLTLIPCADWHVGMFAWSPEVGENWDLKIAEAVIGRGMDDAIGRSPPSSAAIVLGGGDLIHADNSRNETTKGTRQDVDGRWPKVLQTATRMAVRTVDAALVRHQTVTVRILPGNHDEHSAVAVAYFLLAWYRNEPRVTVDVSPSLYFWHRFGSVMLGATHGHTVPIKKMPAIMAHRRAEDWGATRFRYIHGFHLHHSEKTASEGEGVVTEIHQAPIPLDAWSYGSGFLSGRSLQAISYHRSYGEVSRVRVAIMDGAEA